MRKNLSLSTEREFCGSHRNPTVVYIHVGVVGEITFRVEKSELDEALTIFYSVIVDLNITTLLVAMFYIIIYDF